MRQTKPLADIKQDAEDELGCQTEWVETCVRIQCSRAAWDEEIADEVAWYESMGYETRMEERSGERVSVVVGAPE